MRRACLALLCLLIAGLVQPVTGQDANLLPDIPGRIAYIGMDYNVYTIDSGEEDHTALTTDAGVSGDTLRYYQLPTWSSDGRLAFFATILERSGAAATEILIATAESSETESVYTGDGQNLTYAYWSPRNCGDNCRDLAVLLGDSSVNGFVVELIRSGERSRAIPIGTGAPFYFSWSADGESMIWHRNNQRIDIFDVGSGEVVETLEETPGVFAAPGWSPVDDRLLFGAAAGSGETDLVIAANGVVTPLASGLTGPVWFAWSPDGSHVAYKHGDSPLFVVDTATGRTVARAQAQANIVAFFWSPDSRSIAYVTPFEDTPGSFSAKPNAQQEQPQVPRLRWSVLDVAQGSVRQLSAFTPTQEMIYLLSFFDQFAYSHRVWSPDSRHLIYAEIAPDRHPVISLLDATQAIAVPLIIADGVFGVWSFD